MSTDFYNFYNFCYSTWINFQQYEVLLPTAPNVCFYTTLVKMNCQISKFLTASTGFISTITFFLFSIPTYTPAWMPMEDNSSTSCLSCQVSSVFLTLFFFNFLNFMLTVCIFNIFFWCMSKNIKIGLENEKKLCGNNTSVSC